MTAEVIGITVAAERRGVAEADRGSWALVIAVMMYGS
jgi:hypothetical protein